jgi:S1-C subfamily serine protease
MGVQVNSSNGTGFMIAPGVISTAAHLIHLNSNISAPQHTLFKVIRAPDIGQQMEQAQLIAEDMVRDIALLRIEQPRSNQSVTLNTNIVPIGTSSGSLGFPLAFVNQTGFNLVLRFQGANISAFLTSLHQSGRNLSFYETDALMYNGSSGCPGFTSDEIVFGMHTAVRNDPRTTPQGQQASLSSRLAISLWVPSVDIIAFARSNGVTF